MQFQEKQPSKEFPYQVNELMFKIILSFSSKSRRKGNFTGILYMQTFTASFKKSVFVFHCFLQS